MKYIVDNDLHIHSKLSPCSGDPEQTAERILKYAKENGYKTICVTDHFWDESVADGSPYYKDLTTAYISSIKPLPQTEGVRFLFGCEAELGKFSHLGLSKDNIDKFDFFPIATTHFHLGSFMAPQDTVSAESRAKAWVKRFDAVLDMDLPFHKVGIAHLTCSLIAPSREEYLKILNLIPTEEMIRLFTKASQVGIGIELNSSDMSFKPEETDTVLRPYKIAKECGCKFYCGSDAHHPKNLDNAKPIFERAVDMLSLTEEDKFII